MNALRAVGRYLRGVLTTVLVLALVVSVAVTVFRVVDWRTSVAILGAALAPYALVGFGAVLVLALLLFPRSERSRGLLVGGALLSLAGLLLQLIWLMPLWLGVAPRLSSGAVGSRVTLMSLNLLNGSADPAAVVRSVQAEGASVVVLEETTPAELDRLRKAGLDRLLPHRVGNVADQDVMVYSRFPLTGFTPIPTRNPGLLVRVAAPTPFTLAGVHVWMPGLGVGSWSQDLGLLQKVVGAEASGRAFVMAGDFNSTRDVPAFRKVLDAGARDSAEVANSGWQPTWPAARRPLLVPQFGGWSVVTIDHVLVNASVSPLSTSTRLVAGTDHRALVAHLFIHAPQVN